jgi:hypothetical protein
MAIAVAIVADGVIVDRRRIKALEKRVAVLESVTR